MRSEHTSMRSCACLKRRCGWHHHLGMLCLGILVSKRCHSVLCHSQDAVECCVTHELNSHIVRIRYDTEGPMARAAKKPFLSRAWNPSRVNPIRGSVGRIFSTINPHPEYQPLGPPRPKRDTRCNDPSKNTGGAWRPSRCHSVSVSASHGIVVDTYANTHTLTALLSRCARFPSSA